MPPHNTARGQRIGTTSEHPFFVVGRGWVPAAELNVGDVLASHDGQDMVVEAVEIGDWQVAYNLRVQDYHTYFVGCPEWGFSVWSHNACYERYASEAEVYMYDIANQNFTILTNEGIKFDLTGTVNRKKLATTARLRTEKYDCKFDVVIPSPVVALLRKAGVREASGHPDSLDIRTEAQLAMLNYGKGPVVVTNVLTGKIVGGWL